MDANLAIPLHRADEHSLLTYSGAVKRWESDRNGHMNVQFYVRAFQMASEMTAIAATGQNPGAASAKSRHYRFHRELFTGDTFEIRSSRIADGVHAGAVVHWMLAGSDLHLSATAIEMPNYPVDSLPAKPEAALTKALPRGLRVEPYVWQESAFSRVPQLPLTSVGIVRPGDLDHTGDIQANILASLFATASHDLLNQVGMTAAWVDETERNRMSVEMQLTRHGPLGAGQFLNVVSGIAEVATRKFMTRHQAINASTGEPCATMEQLMLVVDLKARKPVEVPEFVHEAQARFNFGQSV